MTVDLEEGTALWRGVALIVVLGGALGIAQNAMMRRGEDLAGLKDYQRRSLDWKYEKKTLIEIPGSVPPTDGVAEAVEQSPPDGEPAKVSLPVLPNSPQPMMVQLPMVKAFVDQDGAAIIDARPLDQYAEGHIPGAVNMPFDEVVTNPARLESFDAKGRPIIVYCGGGACESSIQLAYAMLQSGQKRLVVYEGGFPEWNDAGYPVAAARTSSTTPAPSATKLPTIPALPQPMEMQLAIVKAFVDQDAATIVDARPRDQYDEGHIPGAVSMPFDETVTDPARLESFDAKGRPIIIYCGGGACESSMNLAYAMLQAGQKRLVVFTGGFPEWSDAGYPVATAAQARKQS